MGTAMWGRAPKRLIYPTILLVFIATTVNAQIISGVVRSEDGHPADLVNIVLSRNAAIIKTIVSDSAGVFGFSRLGAGLYLISFSKIGYHAVDTLVLSSGTGDLLIVLKKNTSELKGVTVVARKPMIERKIDRIVFNVENNINTSGLDALGLLSKTPLIKVENDAIFMIGKDNVAVMIDGRLQYAGGEGLRAILKSIPAESIESIEVITNPSARYDAQGNGGIVNIVTKKIKKMGYSGVVTSALSYASTFTGREALNFNYNVKKLQLFANLSLVRGSNEMLFSQNIFYPNETWSESDRNTEYYKAGLVMLGFEVPINAKTSFGMSLNELNSHPDMRSDGRINLVGPGQVLDSFYLSHSYADKTYLDLSANAHFSHRFDSTGKKIDIDADYYSNTFNTSNNINSFINYPDGHSLPDSNNAILSGNARSSYVYTLNAVAEMPFKVSTLTYGGKLSFIKSDNGVSLDRLTDGHSTVDTAGSNRFDVHENIQAAFVDFQYRVSGKIELQGGLRGEHTQMGTPDMVRLGYGSYFSVFPNFFFKYKPDKQNVVGFSFGRRFNRPQFTALNPWRVYDNDFSYREGNPDLRPYYSSNFELNYTYGSNFYSVLSYSHTSNQIGSVTLFTDSSDVRETKPFNFLTQSYYILTLGTSLNKIKDIQSVNEVTVYYTDVHSTLDVTREHLAGWGADFKSSNTVTLDKKRFVSGEIDFNWQSPDVSYINQNKGYFYLDLSLSKMFLSKRLQVTLAGRDIFKTKNIRWTTVVDGVTTTAFSNNNSRRIGLTAKYSFGNSKLRKGAAHSADGGEQGQVR